MILAYLADGEGVAMKRWALLFYLLILWGCGGGGGGTSSSPPQLPAEVKFVGVEVSPAQSQLPLGVDLPMRLFATYSNGLRVDVTSFASWSSSQPASVSLNGNVAHALALGDATVTGSYQGKSAQSSLHVTAARLDSLSLEPGQVQLAAGLTQAFRAFGHFSDGTQSEVTASVSWSVVDSNVARFPASSAVLQALRPGSTSLSASLSGVQSPSVRVVVTPATLARLELTPNSARLPVGIAQPFVATGFFSDGTFRTVSEDCSWSSSNTTVLLVSNLAGTRGLAAGAGEGQADLRASLGGVTASVSVQVTAAVLQSLQIDTPSPLPRGLTTQMRASGTFSDGSVRDLTQQSLWNSSTPAVASISNLPGQTGEALGVSLGNTTISASLSGVQAQVQLQVIASVLQSIEVTPANGTVPVGLTQNFQATGRFSDNEIRDLTSQVAWSSGSPAQATIDSSGLALGLVSGTTTIEARLGSVRGTTPLTVTPAVLQSLDVAPVNSSLPKGNRRNFSAQGNFSDGSHRDLTDEVSWASSDPTRASISNLDLHHGEAQGLALGNTTISAQRGAVQASTTLQITDPELLGVFIEPGNLQLPRGTRMTVEIIARYGDGSSVSLTGDTTPLTPGGPRIRLIPDDPNLISVGYDYRSGLGNLMEALNIGTTTLRCQTHLGPASTQVTVTDATLRSLEIAPVSNVLSSGQTQDLSALGHYTDGQILDLTRQVTWSSANSAVASLSNAPGSQGRLTAVARGQASLQASLGSTTTNATVVVDPAQPPGSGWSHRQGLDVFMDGLAFGNGLWVAANIRGPVVRVSNDGVLWQSPRILPRLLGSNRIFSGAVAFGQGRFVADAGNNTVSVSTDGRSWTPVALPLAPDTRGVDSLTFGNGMFLGIHSQTLVRSNDGGASWTTANAPLAGRLEFTNGHFSLLYGGLQTSSDGLNWTLCTPPTDVRSLSHNGQVYVGVGAGGAIFTSSDLVQFTRQTSPTTRDLVKVVAGGGRFVAINVDGDKFSSPDGVAWSAVGNRGGKILEYSSTQGFLVGSAEASLGTQLEASSDGVSWRSLSSSLNADAPTSKLIAPITFGPAGFVWKGHQKTHFSSDGITWTTQASAQGLQQLNGLSYVGGRYYLLGGGAWHRSDNAVNWQSLDPPAQDGPLGVQLVYGLGRYLLSVGSTSSNGRTFVSQQNPIGGLINDVAFGGGRFVMVGNGRVAASTDGLSWTPSASAYSFISVEYAFGTFVATDADGNFATSSDGLTWTLRYTANYPYRQLKAGNGLLVAYGGYGIATSSDGIHWNEILEAGFPVTDLAAGLGIFVATGPGGSIFTSP